MAITGHGPSPSGVKTFTLTVLPERAGTATSRSICIVDSHLFDSRSRNRPPFRVHRLFSLPLARRLNAITIHVRSEQHGCQGDFLGDSYSLNATPTNG